MEVSLQLLCGNSVGMVLWGTWVPIIIRTIILWSAADNVTTNNRIKFLLFFSSPFQLPPSQCQWPSTIIAPQTANTHRWIGSWVMRRYHLACSCSSSCSSSSHSHPHPHPHPHAHAHAHAHTQSLALMSDGFCSFNTHAWTARSTQHCTLLHPYAAPTPYPALQEQVLTRSLFHSMWNDSLTTSGIYCVV